jgi:hypothetical protein
VVMTFFTLQAWSVSPCVRPISAVHMTAEEAMAAFAKSWRRE